MDRHRATHITHNPDGTHTVRHTPPSESYHLCNMPWDSLLLCVDGWYYCWDWREACALEVAPQPLTQVDADFLRECRIHWEE